MTQIYYRANLTDAQFPLVSTFQGKTVIQQGIDQNYDPAPLGSTEDRDKGIPEALYMHNVLPSKYGYKSIAYDSVIDPVTGSTGFKRIFPVKDFAGNRGHIAITDSRTYLITSANPVWKDVTPAGQPSYADVTVADATGSSFICYSKFNIFTIDLVLGTLSIAALTWDSPTTNASIVGIASSNNYLLAHDGATLYWSSALNVLDFKASQITGAGNGTPTAMVGAIIALAKVGIGFAIYCQGNIVVATFSGNVQYPWIFKEAPNGAGISGVYSISLTGDEGSNYAWTTAGLLKVTLAGCTSVHPEVTDFLSGRLIDDFDPVTNTFTITKLTSEPSIKVAYIASRYLCISYGQSGLNYAIIYDAALKRWGKIKLDHVQIFDLSFGIKNSDIVTISDFGTLTYADFGLATYADWVPPSPNQAAEAKHSLAFLQADGTIKLANFDYQNYNADAVLLMGKYQVFRANTLAVQGFTVETIESGNNDFSVGVLTSLDGKNFQPAITPYEVISDNIREYYCMTIGQNHAIKFNGSFHIVGLVVIFTKNGNR